MDQLQNILLAFETHSPNGIRECFRQGIDPNLIHNGKPLVYELINMYLRSPRFKECMQVFVEFGLWFDDNALLAVLLDDAETLDQIVSADPRVIQRKYSLDCTFTPLEHATLLHVCAEYNHSACADVLLHYGADVNTLAGRDELGFGGHTPIFHTVNQHENNSMDMLILLVSNNADLQVTVPGLVWGKGYEWETFIPSVNPISYAMMGLLPQFQRTESKIYEVVSLLLKARYGIDYMPANIPNRYLRK